GPAPGHVARLSLPLERTRRGARPPASLPAPRARRRARARGLRGRILHLSDGVDPAGGDRGAPVGALGSPRPGAPPERLRDRAAGAERAPRRADERGRRPPPLAAPALRPLDRRAGAPPRGSGEVAPPDPPQIDDAAQVVAGAHLRARDVDPAPEWNLADRGRRGSELAGAPRADHAREDLDVEDPARAEGLGEEGARRGAGAEELRPALRVVD